MVKFQSVNIYDTVLYERIVYTIEKVNNSRLINVIKPLLNKTQYLYFAHDPFRTK